MKKAELAQALGISASMVSRLAKRGMPVDCVDRAKRWRNRHIEPGRIKGVRFDPKAEAQRQAALHEAIQAATQQAGPHLRESLGLLEEAMGVVMQRELQGSPGLTAVLDGLRGQFLTLVVGRCGGLEKAALHWWQWCSLLPAELSENDDINQHLEAECSQAVTLAEFHKTLESVHSITLAQLHAVYLSL